MKKVIFTLALAAFAFTGNAQILKKTYCKDIKMVTNWRNRFIVRKRRQLP